MEKPDLTTDVGSPPEIFHDRSIMQVVHMLDRVAKTDAPVIICGESGVGKEILAARVHAQSGRKGEFLRINCAALPRELIESELFGSRKGSFTGSTQDRQGLIEAADGGTLLLDEMADMPLDLQAKLLRVIQDGQVRQVGDTKYKAVNVRYIATLNKRSTEALARGQFRDDLYYRLAVIEVFVPPLRDRPAEIPLHLHNFLSFYSFRYNRAAPTLMGPAYRALTHYHWPGNIRQLRNEAQRLALVTGTTVQLNDLSPPIIEAQAKEKEVEVEPTPEAEKPKRKYVRKLKGPDPLTGKIQKLERRTSKKRFTAEDVLDALKQTHGNKAAASRILNTDAAYVSILVRRFAQTEPRLSQYVPVDRRKRKNPTVPEATPIPAPALAVS